VQFDPTTNLVGLAGRDVVSFQLPLPQDGELVLGVEILAVRTAALGFPQARWRSTKEPGSISRRAPRRRARRPRNWSSESVGTGTSFTTDINNNVRKGACQDLLKICNNDLLREWNGSRGVSRSYRRRRPTVCEITDPAPTSAYRSKCKWGVAKKSSRCTHNRCTP
jgi:hypothetical protein